MRAEVIRQLLDEGAYRIHLRKPDATTDELRRYLDAVHPELFKSCGDALSSVVGERIRFGWLSL